MLRLAWHRWYIVELAIQDENNRKSVPFFMELLSVCIQQDWRTFQFEPLLLDVKAGEPETETHTHTLSLSSPSHKLSFHLMLSSPDPNQSKRLINELIRLYKYFQKLFRQLANLFVLYCKLNVRRNKNYYESVHNMQVICNEMHHPFVKFYFLISRKKAQVLSW